MSGITSTINFALGVDLGTLASTLRACYFSTFGTLRGEAALSLINACCLRDFEIVPMSGAIILVCFQFRW